MRIALTVFLVSALALSGCGTKLNPMNWFGPSKSRPVQKQTQAEKNPLIPEGGDTIFSGRRKKKDVYLGTPVAEVTALEIDRTADGAIIRAQGRAVRAGAYDVRLVADDPAQAPDGVLSFTLSARAPDGATVYGGGTGVAVQAAQFVETADLRNVREVRVHAVTNERVTRR